MRLLSLTFLLSLGFLLSACNNDEDSQSNSPPSPQPSCKVHCAP
ncbi:MULTISPECIES: hypothetical protein [unclassified Acinetobacter]|nr:MULTISPECIES: hypothetical protein [unclassified Acinetobacter]